MYSVIGFPTLAVCYLLRPFKLVRFGHLYTSRIGHLCLNFDNYLSLRRAHGSNEAAIFTTDAKIANETVFGFWRRQRNVVFSPLGRPAYWLLNEFFRDSPMFISFEKEMHPVVSTHSASRPTAALTGEERERGERLVQSLGIDGPFICFHSRDSAYLELHGGDSNVHDFRDFDFGDYERAIRQTTNAGYYAVRIGEVVRREAKELGPRFISATGPRRTNFSDVYLASTSLFFVGCTSGISHVPRLFRRPELLVNYIPLRIPELSSWSAGSVIIPKKLYSRKLGRLLRFSEMVSLPYDIHYRGDFFGERGITVVDISQTEIAEAVLEMEARVTGRWTDSEKQRLLQSEFWKSLAGNEHAHLIRHELEITIGSRFLERNPELI